MCEDACLSICAVHFLVFTQNYDLFWSECLSFHSSCNDTVSCSFWTGAHLSFDEQKLIPEERGQHLDQGFTKGNKMKRETLDG